MTVGTESIRVLRVVPSMRTEEGNIEGALVFSFFFIMIHRPTNLLASRLSRLRSCALVFPEPPYAASVLGKSKAINHRTSILSRNAFVGRNRACLIHAQIHPLACTSLENICEQKSTFIYFFIGTVCLQDDSLSAGISECPI